MSKRIAKYELYINLASTGTVKAASVALREVHGVLDLAAFRYTQEYLDRPEAIPLDPLQLPLTRNDINLHCRGSGIPGILDDYLPDAWGRKVLSHLAFYKHQKHIQSNSPIDLLGVLGKSRIGALQWLPEGEIPNYELGADISRIEEAERTSQAVAAEDYTSKDADEYSLSYLANVGSGVGGARPKALVFNGSKAYLAKFNAINKDEYNNARVELACLLMAKQAGVNVYPALLKTGINGREVLLLERFDVLGINRRHLISINTLLKSKKTQQDHGGVFRYDDIANIIKKWSTSPREDLEQLLRQMLFNAAINNTDDHERNFSLINDGEGYRLSPAYDMVPSLAIGQYHVAGFQYSPNPPKTKEVKGKIFGLPTPTVNNIVEEVNEAIEQWERFAKQAGVNEQDFEALGKVIARK